jgi:NAD+ synthase (glutamine-hydrolysing)
MKIAIFQINPLISDFKGQFERIAAACAQAVAWGCDLAVFPELALCGYPPRDLLEQKSFVDNNRRCLDRLVQTVRGIGVICGLVARNPADTGKTLFNAAALFENGRSCTRCTSSCCPPTTFLTSAAISSPASPPGPWPTRGAASA